MAKVFALSKCATHAFTKQTVPSIFLIKDKGVEGDAHCGITVKHRSRVKKDPTQPNLRQVHLIHVELIEQLKAQGFDVYPATMGENITTCDLDLLLLPTGTILEIGQAKIKLTGLRNPCKQLNDYQPGLMQAVLDKDNEGNLIRKAGVMAVVTQSGQVYPGDNINMVLPELPHMSLECV